MKIRRIALALLWFAMAAGYVSARTEVLFSPDDKPTTRLLECIKNTQRRIYAAVYMLTDKTIAEALIDAKKKRNIDIQIVIDKISYDSIYGKGKMLHESGLTLFVFDPPKTTTKTRAWGAGPIMHHKFALFDNILWTGSFNWTVAANRANQENVIITDDYEACRNYEGCFERLKKLSAQKVAEYRTPQRESSAIETFIHAWKNFTHKDTIN